ncbi:MAG: LacI family DNA-binding transcriptional regulator [Kiritimatiellae bacterium]|nr:LacI family DNA-binding transcriptional regulator [Kiritimatiellia bacterium]
MKKRKPPRAVTIKDVARMAGVSIWTVSRVVNERDGVSEASEARVRQAIKALRYRPNIMARALKGRATQSIGLIIPSIENPVFPPLVKVIENTAAERGYSTVLCISDGRLEKEAQQLELLVDKRVDGILFNAMGGYHEGFEILRETGTPVVVIGRKIPGFETTNVSVDNRLGAKMAVDHLIRTGMRKIAVLLGQLEASSAIEDRFAGYKDALATHEIEFREERVARGNWSFAGGVAATNDLLTRGVEFDSIFASNDSAAIGCIETLLANGLRIPGDISVIGYDDAPVASMIRPHLSTVRAPNALFGVQAVNTLVKLVETGEDAHSEVVFEPELMVRDSTGSALGS